MENIDRKSIIHALKKTNEEYRQYLVEMVNLFISSIKNQILDFWEMNGGR